MFIWIYRPGQAICSWSRFGSSHPKNRENHLSLEFKYILQFLNLFSSAAQEGRFGIKCITCSVLTRIVQII